MKSGFAVFLALIVLSPVCIAKIPAFQSGIYMRIDVPEVHADFYFWPDWRFYRNADDFVYGVRDLPLGTGQYEILLRVIWPESGSRDPGLLLYAAVFDPKESAIIANIDVTVWGYGP